VVDVVVRVNALGKRYRLGLRREPYRSLRDSLANALHAPRRRLPAGGVLWALRDVSLVVKRGEAVGIIGANGAGKSTLLKILSRITEPTEGEAEVRGRVGSLLEVGTGFHPELSGRDNVYLNGAILGMRRREIERRFDEIVAFAELERFIDTPVKRYSTGMYVRLAFSVAAHLDVEILAVDEILAVGDAAFQQRCLGKMQEATAGRGRTVLFVSHNLGAIRLLTESCLLLSEGRRLEYGPTADVVGRYLQSVVRGYGGGVIDLRGAERRRGVQKPTLGTITYEAVRLLNDKGETTDVFFERDPIVVEVTVRARGPARSPEFIVVVLNMDGAVIFSSFSGRRYEGVPDGEHRVSCRIDPNLLRAGIYRIRLYLRTGEWQDIVPEAALIRIQANPSEGDELSVGSASPGFMGIVRVDATWGDMVEGQGPAPDVGAP
jgi:lipopolysaccharide transport system ATP-binding protein